MKVWKWTQDPKVLTLDYRRLGFRDLGRSAAAVAIRRLVELGLKANGKS